MHRSVPWIPAFAGMTVDWRRHDLLPRGAASPMPTLPATSPAAPAAQGHPPPEIIPLDGPAPASKAPPAPSAAEEARSEPVSAAPLPRGGHFAWPVRGHVLAGYGVTAGG